jgi:hypothetical protein
VSALEGRPRFPNVFVLCTGRCGSLTFTQACAAAVENYTCGHETNLAETGAERLAYADGHIEIDNRLAWFLGRLGERYGDTAFYVHLVRDREATARSYARRRALGFLLHAWIRGIHVGLEDQPDHLALARDLVDTVNANIRQFLGGQAHVMRLRLEDAAEDFTVFHERIGALGDVAAGCRAFDRRYNATATSALPPAERGAPAACFPANAPLPEYVRGMMTRRLPGRRDADQASVTGRIDDLDDHLSALTPDFAGEPVLCCHVAALVVRVRRGIALGACLAELFSLTDHLESADFLARHLSLRWLVSVLDTLADHAPLAQAAGALALSTLTNTVKLAETERLVMRDPTHDPARVEALSAAFPTPLFGGLNAFRLESGDMVANLFERLETVLVDLPFQQAALARLRRELRVAPSLFHRLATYHPRLF